MRNQLLNQLQGSLLGMAAIFTGIMAGFFWTYTYNINLALAAVDGEMYAIMQSLFNQNVRHSMFFTFFMGAGAVSLVATLAHLPQWRRPTFWLLAVATLTYVVGIILFTRQVNLPLNYYTESWNPTNLPLDWEATRAAWNQANALRVGTSGTAFVLCIVALLSRRSVRG